jgi:hypothetical protein
MSNTSEQIAPFAALYDLVDARKASDLTGEGADGSQNDLIGVRWRVVF